jgi:Putative esterase
MVSRTNENEPRLQIGRQGVPFFGRDVEQLAPGHDATITDADLGFPVAKLSDLPPGDYYVQGFVNVYTDFHRADGHVVWMHDDQWEGQRWNVSPGNLYSDVQRVHIDAASGGVIRLSAAHVIPPVTIPPDTAWVKRFKFRSALLSKFWGRPIYLGATVLLPKDYDRTEIRYPVNYIQGHFSLRAPEGFEVGSDFYKAWVSGDFPRMILVTFQHPNPYFDDSYAVNSPNVGPYGDAVMQELIPEVEKRFRVIREPYARVLSGGSTGGWEALALQVLHPEFFGGTWAYCPDPVTFTNVEGVDVYTDANAFYKRYDWRREPTINSRETDGRVRVTSEQRNHFELVNGTHGRSGEQIDIWSAVFGPLGADGYFEPLFDKRTGEMHPEVAKYWSEHYDLLHYMQRNWSSLGPQLVGKLHVYVGDMDTFYLNDAVRELQAWMKTTEHPHYEGYFLYGEGKPHCWTGPVTPAERLVEMAQFVMAHKPEGATTPWWTY